MSQYALEARNLTKAYPGFTLGPLTLALPSGCIMGLVGENGAGKTTTIKLLLQMLRRDSGSVALLGEDCSSQTASVGIKEQIGVVLDEVGFPECLTAKQVNNILKHTYTAWEENTYFSYLKKLSLPLDKSFGEYSRGMKMKLGIASALSHRAKLLILDEATSGLDPVVREEILDIFNDFTRDEGHSILMSSHIVSDLEKTCDYIAFLHKGKLLVCEEKDRILEKYGMLHCTMGQLQKLAPSAVLGKRVSPYGVEAVVERSQLLSSMEAGPVSLEELFVMMVKGETQA